MGGKSFADHAARSGDEVEDPRWHAGGVDDVRKHERVQRCDSAWLQNEGTTGRERRRDLARNLMEGVVPRRDRADDAGRLSHDDRVADPFLPEDLLHPLADGRELIHR